jgi:hypothetical protein
MAQAYAASAGVVAVENIDGRCAAHQYVFWGRLNSVSKGILPQKSTWELIVQRTEHG